MQVANIKMQILAKMSHVVLLEKYAMEAFANVENQTAVSAMKRYSTVISKTANVNVQKMLRLAQRDNNVSMKNAENAKTMTTGNRVPKRVLKFHLIRVSVFTREVF